MNDKKTFPMSQYASSKDREQAIFEHIKTLENILTESKEKQEEYAQTCLDLQGLLNISNENRHYLSCEVGRCLATIEKLEQQLAQLISSNDEVVIFDRAQERPFYFCSVTPEDTEFVRLSAYRNLEQQLAEEKILRGDANLEIDSLYQQLAKEREKTRLPKGWCIEQKTDYIVLLHTDGSGIALGYDDSIANSLLQRLCEDFLNPPSEAV